LSVAFAVEVELAGAASSAPFAEGAGFDVSP
jgi:hypothetical protein